MGHQNRSIRFERVKPMTYCLMHSRDEGETFSSQNDHLMMVLDVMMHELSIHQEELGSILNKAPHTRFQEVGRCEKVK